MRFQIGTTSHSMSFSPMAGNDLNCASKFVYSNVDAEQGFDHRGHAFAFLMNRIALKHARFHIIAPSSLLEIESQHMSRRNCPRRSEPGTDRLPPASKSCKVMETNPAGKDNVSKVA